MTRARGFTLIELLVAVAIFGLLAVLGYGGLSRLLEHQNKLESEHAFWRELSVAFLRLGDDLVHTRARPVRDASGFPLSAFRGQPTDTRALAEPSIEFTRGGVAEFGAARRADLRRVAYRLRDGALERLTWPALDRAPVSPPQEMQLLRDVEIFEVRFYSRGGARLERWPADNSDELPRAVEISLEIAGRGKFTRLFLVNE